MEMYGLHSSSQAPNMPLYKRATRGFARMATVRNALKVAMGVVAAFALFIVVRSICWHSSSSNSSVQNLALAPQPKIRTSNVRSPVTRLASNGVSGGSFRQNVRPLQKTRDPNLKANFRRVGYGPWFDFGMGSPMGKTGGFVGDMFDIFDELSAFSDIEDMLTYRRKLRDHYQEEVDAIRNKRREERAERLNKKDQESGRPVEGEKSTYQAAAPMVKKEIQIDSPFGLQKFGSGWAIPAIAEDHDNENYKYIMDIQGMDRENIKLSLQDRILIVEGQQMVETENGYHSSSFKRSFSLPFDADIETLKSQELSDGKLLFQASRNQPISESPIREIEITRIPSEVGKYDSAALNSNTQLDSVAPTDGANVVANSAPNDGANSAPNDGANTDSVAPNNGAITDSIAPNDGANTDSVAPNDGANIVANAINQGQDDLASGKTDGVVEDAPPEDKI